MVSVGLALSWYNKYTKRSDINTRLKVQLLNAFQLILTMPYLPMIIYTISYVEVTASILSMNKYAKTRVLTIFILIKLWINIVL